MNTKFQEYAPTIIWFTGLSGAGKTTTATALAKELVAKGCKTYLLDADKLRQGLCADLSFSEADRKENMRRIGEVAKLFLEAGYIVLVACISPFRQERQMVRNMVQPGQFIEVYVNTPLEICEQRDPKGLYKKARSGLIKNFTGIDSPYEPPENPEIEIDTGLETTHAVIDRLIKYHILGSMKQGDRIKNEHDLGTAVRDTP